MQSEIFSTYAPKPRRRLFLLIAFAICVLSVIALNTTVVGIGSDEDRRASAFSPDAYAKQKFPDIKDYVTTKAVDISVFLDAVQADKKAAVDEYGIGSGAIPIIPISFSGVLEEGKSGIYYVDVEGVADEVKIRVQTGPAINGTDLRDATGQIKFGDFKNQIEYQDVGAAINRAMKADTLESIEGTDIEGKSVDVIGVFKLINPKAWLITPVRFEVK